MKRWIRRIGGLTSQCIPISEHHLKYMGWVFVNRTSITPGKKEGKRVGFGDREVWSQIPAVPFPAGWALSIFLSLFPCLPHEGSNSHVLSSEEWVRYPNQTARVCRVTHRRAWDAFVEWIKKEESAGRWGAGCCVTRRWWILIDSVTKVHLLSFVIR